jgi:hypothetical protein
MMMLSANVIGTGRCWFQGTCTYGNHRVTP